MVSDLWGLIGGAVALGFVHGVEPGHGWPIAATYAMEKGNKWLYGAAAGTILGIGHLVSSIAMVVVFFAAKSYFNLTQLPWISQIAGVLLILLGLYELRGGGHHHGGDDSHDHGEHDDHDTHTDHHDGGRHDGHGEHGGHSHHGEHDTTHVHVGEHGRDEHGVFYAHSDDDNHGEHGVHHVHSDHDSHHSHDDHGHHNLVLGHHDSEDHDDERRHSDQHGHGDHSHHDSHDHHSDQHGHDHHNDQHGHDHHNDQHGHDHHEDGVLARLTSALPFVGGHSHSHRLGSDPAETSLWSIAWFAFLLGFAHEEEFEIILLCTGSNYCLELMTIYALTVIVGIVSLTLLLVAGYYRYEDRVESVAEHFPTISAAILISMGLGFLFGVF
ncbi:hypothetical protein ELS19_05505 [Halogeometricum borinquense]|uniref:Nickel/cobalt efflux system n=1 Tax=Halogeometricum borinquense TaxID=60847 RepID=A0A482T9R8_9EURY|nr:hypothetical protein [Halogeometricum borinquense]RYJ13472.1 hypothetical protein ELS19_05505 [Halogeometricum borinquense]